MTEVERRQRDFEAMWNGFRETPLPRLTRRAYEAVEQSFRDNLRLPLPAERTWRATLYCGHVVEFRTRADMAQEPRNPYDLRNGRQCSECGRWCVYMERPEAVTHA
jgi:hypothetical protein